MFVGRQLPHRLIGPGPGLATGTGTGLALGLALAFACSACVSDRYVGSIGRDGTYSNRGYGVAVPLRQAGLYERWKAIDPSAIEEVAPELRPTIHDEPIDLDGNGELEMGETTRFLRPMLRLISKTSTGAVMSLDTTILGKNNEKINLEGLMLLELAKFEGAKTSTATLESVADVAVPSGYAVRIAEIALERRAFRVALVDQNELTAENGKTRRQIIRVMLSAPELDDRLKSDQNLLLKHLYLARKSGGESVQELW